MEFLFQKKSVFACCAIIILSVQVFRLEIRLQNNQFAKTEIIYNQTSAADLAIVEAISQAHKYVYFVMYTITKENIADALIAAKLKGLDVRGVLDFNQSIIPQEKPIISKMKKYGIQMEIPFKTAGIIHMKLLVTDNVYAQGSFNWTSSATTINDEVLEIGSTESFREKYAEIFWSVWDRYKNSGSR